MAYNNYIKNLKPRKNGRYHQGVIDPRRLKKYYDGCKNEPVIYRSALELRFIQYCENNAKISKWASEPIEIPYHSRLKGHTARYYPDYVCESVEGTRIIVEIKPFEQTRKPDAEASQWLKEAWVMNVDKWTAAKKFADDHGMKFVIVTEKFFDRV